ncbi:MAG: HlyD family efflux transporter periplasmic adaptor subunit [Phycisphaerales bacterium]|nr:HlyD family efflux transporter periplasmic adaptor subunit [Phycisphaerales bacterium]
MTFSSPISTSRQQVLIDEQQLAKLQSEFARRALELERLKASFEILAAVNAPARFLASAMALCNELASRYKAERVGIGFLKGRYIRLKALSHTEKITRHMQLVQDIESAMEECLDQDVEVIVPATKEASYVYRATNTLSLHHGQNAICSLPLRRKVALAKKADRAFESDVVAVLTLERTLDKPFTLEEIETLRLTSDLFTARLVDLYEQDRWLGSKLLRESRKAAAWVVGPKNTWPKVAAIAVCALLAFAIFVPGTHKVEAPFTLEAIERQILSAPVEAPLLSVGATAGDYVVTESTAAQIDAMNAASPLIPMLPFRKPATVLAKLDTYQLEKTLLRAQSEQQSYIRQAMNYRAQGKEADAQTADAQAKHAQADADLYASQIEQATIKAPLDGIVLSGDLKTKIGAPIKLGDELFQVGQHQIRAELSVPEDQIAYISVNQTGKLAATSFPDQKIDFTVERVFPVAVVSGGHNVFKVRALINSKNAKSWMKPGVEGIAKVEVDKAKYGWIWTHRLVNWIRMKLWL